MSEDEYLGSEQFKRAAERGGERAAEARLRELGIDSTTLAERGPKIEALEREVGEQRDEIRELREKLERLERYEDRLRTAWLVVRWIGGILLAGGTLSALERIGKLIGWL